MVENQSQKGVKESHSVAFHQKTGLEVGGRAQTVRQPADDFPDKIKATMRIWNRVPKFLDVFELSL